MKALFILSLVTLSCRKLEHAATLKIGKFLVYVCMGACPVLVSGEVLYGAEQPLVVGIEEPFAQKLAVVFE